MLLLLFNSTPAPSSANKGRLRVYTSSTATAIKPVKVWNGSSWVIKPVKVWNGSSWVITFNSSTYSITQDTNDPGFYVGNGATENSSDPGFYDIQGNAAREDTSEPGTYLTS